MRCNHPLLLMALPLAVFVGCEEVPSKIADTGVQDAAPAADTAAPDTAAPDTAVPDAAPAADTGPAADSGAIADAKTPCPAVEPSGLCAEATSPTCTYGTRVCKCTAVCSGVAPPLGQTHDWTCAEAQPAGCPQTVPQKGTACSTEGVTCVWPTCGPTTADCTNGVWQVNQAPPPP